MPTAVIRGNRAGLCRHVDGDETSLAAIEEATSRGQRGVYVVGLAKATPRTKPTDPEIAMMRIGPA